jgi:RNA polymerase sigma factor (sigma-70 family)
MYDAHYKTVKTTVQATLISNNNDDIQGCINDVFMSAYQKKDLDKHPGIGGWLFLCAKNTAHNYNKRSYFANRYIQGEIPETAFADDFVNALLEDMDYDSKIKTGAVESILDRFNKAERDFYNLKYIRQLSDDEISRLSGMSLNLIRVKTHRLKIKAKQLINELG